MRKIFLFFIPIILFTASCADNKLLRPPPSDISLNTIQKPSGIISPDLSKKPRLSEPQIPFEVFIDSYPGHSGEIKLFEPSVPDETAELDVPIVINEAVQSWIAYFQGPGRKAFTRGLAQSTRYLPMMKQIFKEAGLPEDLVYLSLIESNFNAKAYSRSHASGLWQFIKSTGTRYGLVINDWVDERRHPEKSTRAAAQYLSDLHNMFGCWHLAAAAYNAGEGRITRALDKFESQSFWEIAAKEHLHQETRNYVPKFIAALLLAKNPEQYGFTDIEYQSVVEHDLVFLKSPIDLAACARLLGTGLDIIRDLNPHLKKASTPPGERNYPFYLPKGASAVFEDNYTLMKPAEQKQFASHKIARGDTLGGIAARYHTSVKEIKNLNRLRSNVIVAGRSLKVPASGDSSSQTARITEPKSKADRIITAEKVESPVTYQVQPGENIYRISLKYNVRWQDIVAWNNIRDVKNVSAGQKLVLYLNSDRSKKDLETQLRAKDEDTGSVDNQSGIISYTVRSGDNLWAIARRFNTDAHQIRTWNNMKDNLIKPGDVLTLRTKQM